MARSWMVRLFAALLVLQTLCEPALAYKKEVRLPLAGCRGFFAASGSATYTEVIADATQKASYELFVEIKNMPLPPGTILVVSVDEQTIGRVTLDSRRNASLRLTGDKKKIIAPLNWGSQVNLTKVDGTVVVW